MIKLFFWACITLFGLYVLPTPIREIKVKKEEMTLSVDNYRKEGILFSEDVYVQSLLETGFHKSRIYKENHNPHGMKWNRRGYAEGVQYGHAKYDCIENALKDYKEWQKIMMKRHLRSYHNDFKTEEDYYFFLNHLYKDKNGVVYTYADDPDYTKKLKKIKDKIKNEWVKGEREVDIPLPEGK